MPPYTATVVILAWNAWERTKTCLESLRPTLRMSDKVVVVDNGSTDGTRSGLLAYPWVEVRRQEQNVGCAAGRNLGAANATTDVVVFLDSDTIPSGRWLDALLGPFDEPCVSATGPMSNSAPHSQQVSETNYKTEPRKELHSFARSWAAAHRGEQLSTRVISGSCLAVRRDSFEAVGGFDEIFMGTTFEDEDLCVRLSEAGGRLVIASESYMHHLGQSSMWSNSVSAPVLRERGASIFESKYGRSPLLAESEPLLSACLIVKDEETQIGPCLASIKDLVDEVVVYDTGSVDNTKQIAADAGAVVLDGYWDDNFARARNAALANCRGTWILWIDADERAIGDLAALRDQLAADTATEGFRLHIENLSGVGISSRTVHPAGRLFRRSAGSWHGRLHEQVWSKDSSRPLRLVDPVPETVRLEHHGYLSEVTNTKNKAERNLRLAKVALDEARGIDRPYALLNLARSHHFAGNHQDALGLAIQAADIATASIDRRFATRTVVDCLIALDRADEASPWIQKLRADSSDSVLADVLEGNVLLRMKDFAGAVSAYSQLDSVRLDDDGMEYSPSQVATPLSFALSKLDRSSEAADILLGILREHGMLDTHLGTLIEYLQTTDRDLNEIVNAIPDTSKLLFLGQALQLRDEHAQDFLEASWARWADLPTLAAGAELATRLSLEKALEWSVRVRERSLSTACPILTIARDETRSALERSRAAAIALGAFKDPLAYDLLAAAIANLSGDDADRFRTELPLLCPDLASGAQPATVPSQGTSPVSATPPLPTKTEFDFGTNPVATTQNSSVVGQPDHPGKKRLTLAKTERGPVSILWAAPLLNSSGYAYEGRNFVHELTKRGLHVGAYPLDIDPNTAISPKDRKGDNPRASVARARQRALTLPMVLVQHAPAHGLLHAEGTAHHIVRTMFETDSIPEGWVKPLNSVDEIWVPSKFNVETFRNCGVKSSITVVPGGVDTNAFRPGLEPFSLPGLRETVFLSVFEWHRRKGWDLLIRAWANAFKASDQVTLVLRAGPPVGIPKTPADINKELDDFITHELGTSRSALAPIILLDSHVENLGQLYASADAFVLPSRGEGWGLPYLEAMASGLPTIGTNWSGNTEFMTSENSILLDVEKFETISSSDAPSSPYIGQRWARPSIEHLTTSLRYIHLNRDAAKEIGQRARRDAVQHWTWAQAGEIAAQRLRDVCALIASPPSPRRNTVRVQWVGDQFARHSLSVVNREVASRLVSSARLDLEIYSTESPELSPWADMTMTSLARRTGPVLPEGVDVVVRHHWPPNFGPSGTGRLVIAQPWEFGGIPDSWAKALLANADEVWAPTTWVADRYIAAGLPSPMVHVVPHGVDTKHFAPQGPRHSFKQKASFRFLFVGGTIPRKGIDGLISSYLAAFTPADDVALVIKTFGGGSVYREDNMDQRLRTVASDKSTAKVELISEDLDSDAMAALYRSCDILVHPYRGEGYGLTVAEAMASGLPAVVTGMGACMDFCDSDTARLIPATKEPTEVLDVGPSQEGYWWAKPDWEYLTELLRKLPYEREESSRLAANALQRARTSMTWECAATAAEQRLIALQTAANTAKKSA